MPQAMCLYDTLLEHLQHRVVVFLLGFYIVSICGQDPCLSYLPLVFALTQCISTCMCFTDINEGRKSKKQTVFGNEMRSCGKAHSLSVFLFFLWLLVAFYHLE